MQEWVFLTPPQSHIKVLSVWYAMSSKATSPFLNHNRSVNLFDVFILLVVSISFASIFFLVLSKFEPFWAVVTGIALTVIIAMILRLRIEPSIRSFPFSLLLILLIGLIFRAQPYLYLPGGQDQGVYVNMSVAYEQNGSTFVIDDVRKKAVESGLGEFYDSANQIGRGIVKEGAYEGAHLPGVYIKDLSKSEYVFQFYPLHPLWMAIAGKFAGKANRVYSLVFFSLLSIVAFYLLAREISGGNKISSIIISLLLALNPLHAFFSKFPVTEIVALSFSSLSFFYLVRYYNNASVGDIRSFYLVLSSMLFGCMFFTRISGFLYIPFFYFLILITILFERNETIKRQLILYFLSIIVFYALSVAYGMIYSYPYSHEIYQGNFSRFFHSSWQLKLTVTAITAILLLGVFWIFGKQMANLFQSNLFIAIRKHLNTILCLLLTVILGMAFYKAYVFAFTDKYIGGRWDLGGRGWASLVYSNVIVIITYLSPLGLAILGFSIFRIFPRKKTAIRTAFFVFLCLFWYILTVIKFATPYQYYYARYLLSELVPYTLLAICLVLGDLFRKGRWWKITSLCLTLFIAAYFLYFTLHQFKGKSADGAHLALKSIAEVMGERDLLVFYDIHSPFFLETPLSFYYGLNTCYMANPGGLYSIKGKSFLAKFQQVFLITPRLLQIPSLKPIKSIQYKQGQFVRSSFIPTKFHYLNSHLYLYELVNP